MDIQKTKNMMTGKYDADLERKKIIFCKRLTALVEKTKSSAGKNNEVQSAEMGFEKSNLSKYKDSNDFNKPRKIPVPNASTLLRMSDYYGVSIDYLLGKTDFKRPIDTDISGLNEEAKKRIVCDYLNLSEESVEALRKKTKNQAEKTVLNYLFNNKEVFDSVVDYYMTSLIRVFNASDYSLLKLNPVLEQKLLEPDELTKSCFADLLDKLPVSRRDLYEFICSDPILKLEAAHSLARRLINCSAALAQLRDSADPVQGEYALTLLRDLLSNDTPYDKDRFTLEKSMTAARTAFQEAIDSAIGKSSEPNKDEDDPAEDDYIHLPYTPPNDDSVFSSASFCGIKTWTLEHETEKTDNQ